MQDIVRVRKNTYQLNVQVNDLKPIERFMKGMESDNNLKMND
jgi:hypothetical protein